MGDDIVMLTPLLETNDAGHAYLIAYYSHPISQVWEAEFITDTNNTWRRCYNQTAHGTNGLFSTSTGAGWAKQWLVRVRRVQ